MRSRRLSSYEALPEMRDPEGDRARMQRRRDNWRFLLIFGSIVFTTILLVISAKGLHWL